MQESVWIHSRVFSDDQIEDEASFDLSLSCKYVYVQTYAQVALPFAPMHLWMVPHYHLHTSEWFYSYFMLECQTDSIESTSLFNHKIRHLESFWEKLNLILLQYNLHIDVNNLLMAIAGTEVCQIQFVFRFRDCAQNINP